MSGAAQFDFKQISKIICNGTYNHEKNIKQNCVKSSIVSLENFYDGFQREIKEINSEITPSKDHPSIADFADIFKAFDIYPSNITKVKKSAPKELSRMNSTILKGGTTASDVSSKENSRTSLNDSKLHTEKQMSAADIYQDYIKFKQKINVLLQDLQKQTMSEDYSLKLKQINVLAQQLEKLMPSDGICVPAFNKEQELKLENIVQDMEKLSFLKENKDVFNSVSGNSMARLESLVDVLSYSLISISCFNTI